MSVQQRFVTLIGAAFIVLAAAVFVTSRHDQSQHVEGGLLLPTLANQLASVTEVSIRKGSPTATITLHKKGEQWTVAQRADYPADLTKLRALLQSLSQAKIIEEKTSDPRKFPLIGVDEPSVGATGTEIVLSAADGKHAVIVGKAATDGNFVRRGGESKSYLVQPAISVESEPHLWIDGKLIDVPSASVQRIDVKSADGTAYAVQRVAPAQPPKSDASHPAPPPEDSFNLTGVPAGRKAAESAALAPSPSMLSNLTAEDVTDAGTLDLSKSAVAVVALNDGGNLTITGVSVGEKHWITIQGAKDAALLARAQGRAFEIAGYRYEGIFRPLEQLLVPKETPAAKKPTPKATTAKP